MLLTVNVLNYVYALTMRGRRTFCATTQNWRAASKPHGVKNSSLV